LQEANSDLIAVSKLCCPVYWDLMEVLRGDEANKFRVQGRHSTMGPVALPPWLPLADSNAMVQRYRTYLREQISLLLRHDAEADRLASKRKIALADLYAQRSRSASMQTADLSMKETRSSRESNPLIPFQSAMRSLHQSFRKPMLEKKLKDRV
jgi:hypothetical protein